MSPNCERLTGHTPEEFINDPKLLEKITHPDDRAKLTRHHREIYRHPCPNPSKLTMRIVCRDGEERTIEHVCCPIFDSTGTYQGRRASNRDITEQREIENQLRARTLELEQTKQQLQVIHDNIAGGVLFFDSRSLRVKWANPVAASSAGYEQPDQLVGLTRDKLFLDSKHDPECPVLLAAKTKKTEHSERCLVNGRIHEVVAIPVFEQNELVGIVESFTDITQRKNLQLRIESERAKAGVRIASQGRFPRQYVTRDPHADERDNQHVGDAFEM